MVLSEGMGLFINSSIVHRFESDSDCIIPNIVFSPELIAEKDSLLFKKYFSFTPETSSSIQADLRGTVGSVPDRNKVNLTIKQVTNIFQFLSACKSYVYTLL